MPPMKIQKFIEKSEWIPKDVMILTATVDHGPSESDYFLPQGKEDRWFMEEFYEPLMKTHFLLCFHIVFLKLLACRLQL